MDSKFLTGPAYADKLLYSHFLYEKLWRQGTTLLLHAPRQIDKVDKALQIASDVAYTFGKIVYVNTGHGLAAHGSELAHQHKMVIFTPAYDSPDDSTDYADLVMAGIEEAVAVTKSRIFVIDSVTRIASLSFGRNASAAYVMKRLAALQVRYGLSLLVIADDTNKAADKAIAAFADSELSLAPAEDTQPVRNSRVAASRRKSAMVPAPEFAEASADRQVDLFSLPQAAGDAAQRDVGAADTSERDAGQLISPKEYCTGNP